MLRSTHMGSKTVLSVEEYLRTPYDGPEPEFVHGRVVPRATPDTFHSEAVDALIEAFLRQAKGTLFRRPELRIQVAPERYRVVDLAIYDSKPRHAVPERKPLIAIEVLSPDDSYADLMHKFADYAAFGVAHIWLVDPIIRRFSVYHDGSLTAVAQLEVPEHAVSIRLSDIFER